MQVNILYVINKIIYAYKQHISIHLVSNFKHEHTTETARSI